MDKIRAPYNFVPMAATVALPDWADSASIDVPFEDGLSGTLDVRLRAHTPVFVRAGGERKAEFFQVAPGQYAIPGTSVKGCLRNVVEIASFGWLSRLTDRKYAVRDLHNQNLYVRHMATIMQSKRGKNEPLPRVAAGWLRAADPVKGIGVVIQPVDYAKVNYNLLMALAPSWRPGDKQSAVNKYTSWPLQSRDVDVLVDPLRDPLPSSPSRFGVVSRLGPRGSSKTGRPGTLVFTGQPSRWDPSMPAKRGGSGHPKHHDFVFLDKAGPEIHVSGAVWQDFKDVHSDAGEQHRLVDTLNEELRHWWSHLERGANLPVFFLVEGTDVRAIGLAMMFRLAYRHSTHSAVKTMQPEAFKTGRRPDLAEVMFGYLPQREGKRGESEAAGDAAGESEGGLRGRVSVGLFTANRAQPGEPQRVVLGSPKASYYPNYIEQAGDRGPGATPSRLGGGSPSYATMMDDGVRIRGWKRYAARNRVAIPDPPRAGGGRSVSDKVFTHFTPLREGAEFAGKVRFHNLRPVELGALLWALDYGQRAECRHQLGLVCALGFGNVTFELAASRSATRVVGGAPYALDDARRAFAAWMEAQCTSVPGGWACSRQLHELVAIATPVADERDLRHMRIDATEGNEFNEGKRQGLSLAAAGASTWRGMAALQGPPRPFSAGSSAGTVSKVAAATPSAQARASAPPPPVGAAIAAPDIVARFLALPPAQLPAQMQAYVADWRRLPDDNPLKKRLAEAILAQVVKFRKGDKEKPWFKEIEGWVGGR